MVAKCLFDNLTEKQLDVVSCLMFGLSYKDIGKVLGISDRTVEGHVREIVRKTNIVSKDEIIRRIRLSENIDHYKELETRYNEIALSASSQKSVEKFSWRTYSVVFIVLLVFVVVIYFSLRENTETYLQSIKNSTYLLSRQNIIKQMNSSKNRIIILTGQGGAGKTTLARKYVNDINIALKYEVNAESKSSIKSELIGLICVLSKTPKDLEIKNIAESISDEKEKLRRLSIILHQKLKSEKNWCLLLDNLDNQNVFSSMYLDNLFGLDNGTVIITTRNKNIGNYFPDAKIIQIERLNEKEKIELFCKITNCSSSKTIEENLLEIPSYPLDVSCCAHYVKNTGISLPVYVQKMNQMDREFWSGNQKILSDNVNYGESRYSIIASSIENILSQNPKLIKPLFIVSILDSQKIPVDFLVKIIGEHLSAESIYAFQKYGLIDISDRNLSMHRVTQAIMRDYCFQSIQKDTLNKFITKVCDTVCVNENDESMMPHLKSIISNLEDRLPLQDKIKIQIALTYLIQQYGRSPIEAIKYIKQVISTGKSILSPYKLIELQLEGAKLCLSAGKNEEAVKFLKNDLEKLPFNGQHIFSYINYYTLWGIIYMRSRHLKEADDSFDEAIKLLEKIKDNSDVKKITEAAIYSAKGINYLRLYVHKPQMNEAVKTMKYAVSLVSGIDNQKALDVLINTKIRLATAYNSLGVHDEAIKMCEEAEPLLEKIKTKNNNYYSTKGLLYVEHGHALLRKRNFKRAKYYLQESKELFNQLVIYDYFSRGRIQETEALISLKEYDEAYQDCLEVIANGKTDNDFDEMFLTRAYYHAGFIQYKLNHPQQALKHFRDFSVIAKRFCQHFLSKQQFEKLQEMHAFDVVADEKNIKTCFKNALEIFKMICYRNSRFITDYAQKNFDEEI